MKPIFEKSELFDTWNKKVKAIHEAQERLCESIPFRISEDDSSAGIVIHLSDSSYYVDVFDLVNSIFKNGDIWLFKTDNDQNGFHIPSSKEGAIFEWKINTLKPTFFKTYRFTLVDYIDAISDCVKHLIQSLKSGKTIKSGYSNIESDNLELCLSQLAKTWTLPSKIKLTTTSVVPETCCFNPLNCEFNERIEIGFGDRKYVFWLEHWANSYESIRHDLENIYYKASGSVDIEVDLHTSSVEFETVNILNSVEPCGNGYGFGYKKLIKVTINPLSKNTPILCGYCESKQCISEIYEGLLLLALNHPFESNCNDDPSIFTVYNKLKSPIIEAFLTGRRYEDWEVAKRQQIIKEIITIDPNYDYIGEISNRSVVEIDSDGLLSEEFIGKDGGRIKMPGLAEWWNEIKPIIIDSETGHPYSKDWADYHHRGLKLMKELRSKLADDIDLWYRAPFEDKLKTITRPILIIE